MTQNYELPYGEGSLRLDLPDGMQPLVLLPGESRPLDNPLQAVEQALKSPIGTAPLVEMLKTRKPKRITVVVNDETRPTPYGVIFPPLLEAFKESGIKDDQVVFVVATGIHDPQPRELSERIYGKEMVERFRFVNHEARDDSALVDMGHTSSGYPCFINRHAVDTDFLITIGVVMPHYFAGFSGGRKSILPGLAGFETVEKNHARMVELLDALPPIDENPVSLEMIETARKVGVDFIINTVTNEKKQLVSVQAGDLVAAWRKAVDVSAAIYEVPFTKQVDICVACACGYPRDVNVYQAQKALDHAERITRPGGTIIWIGKCQDGYGEKVFVKWLNKHLQPKKLMEEFKKNFELGGHKAYAIAKVAARNRIKLYSDMSRPETELMWADKIENVREALDMALLEYGPEASVAILPQASLSLPVRKK